MKFKMFLAAPVINVFGIILAVLLFYHYAAEYFYSGYAASLSERVYIGAKNADLSFQKIYRANLDISFDAAMIQGAKKYRRTVGEFYRAVASQHEP